eukprot:19571-Chlamydomonas_euryale.AAC.3
MPASHKRLRAHACAYPPPRPACPFMRLPSGLSRTCRLCAVCVCLSHVMPHFMQVAGAAEASRVACDNSARSKVVVVVLEKDPVHVKERYHRKNPCMCGLPHRWRLSRMQAACPCLAVSSGLIHLSPVEQGGKRGGPRRRQPTTDASARG